MKVYSEPEHLNVGSGEDIAIYDLARLVAEVANFTGEILRDTSKPDGTPRKLMSAEKLRALGWAPRTSLRQGIEGVYADFLRSAERVQAKKTA